MKQGNTSCMRRVPSLASLKPTQTVSETSSRENIQPHRCTVKQNVTLPWTMEELKQIWTNKSGKMNHRSLDTIRLEIVYTLLPRNTRPCLDFYRNNDIPVSVSIPWFTFFRIRCIVLQLCHLCPKKMRYKTVHWPGNYLFRFSSDLWISFSLDTGLLYMVIPEIQRSPSLEISPSRKDISSL